MLTKTDLASKQQIGEQLLALDGLGDWAEIVPVSAVQGTQVDLLADLLVRRLPEGPALYPDGELTDEPEQVLVAELIREAALEGVRDELPHSIAVTIEEMTPREGRSPDRPLLDVYATLHVERDSQKAIIIGKQGQMLKTIGTDARKAIQRLLGAHVYLSLRVRVEPRWSERPDGLKKLGYE